MAKQTWVKWGVGLASVMSFSAFMGVLNQYKGVEEGTSSVQAKQENNIKDLVQEEWISYATNQEDHDSDFDDSYEDHDDDDFYDEDKYSKDRSTNENKKKTIMRTRAS